MDGTEVDFQVVKRHKQHLTVRFVGATNRLDTCRKQVLPPDVPMRKQSSIKRPIVNG